MLHTSRGLLLEDLATLEGGGASAAELRIVSSFSVSVEMTA